jgi:hypothetical protein
MEYEAQCRRQGRTRNLHSIVLEQLKKENFEIMYGIETHSRLEVVEHLIGENKYVIKDGLQATRKSYIGAYSFFKIWIYNLNFRKVQKIEWRDIYQANI